MNGVTPKPLIQLGGRALIEPILNWATVLTPHRTIVAISQATELVASLFPDVRRQYIQVEPRGTGYTVREVLAQCTTAQVLIAQADDSYFLRLETIRALMARHEERQADFTVGAAIVTKPTAYAHIERTPEGRLLTVHKQREDMQAPPPKEIVAGLYAGRADWLRTTLPRVQPSTNGEFGLPSVIELGIAAGDRIDAFVIPEAEWQGINTPEEFAKAEAKLALRS